MMPEVKQRIEQIQRGEVPGGYKRTKMGVVPVEWEESRLGDFFSERNENNLPDYPLLSITANRGVIPRSEVEGKDNSSDDKSKYKHICIGDIGYNTMRMWQGVSALSSLDGIISPAYTVLVPRRAVSAKYCAYLFKLQAMVNLFYRNSQGLVDDTRSLKYDWFKEIRVALPLLPEQQKIAEILAAQDKVIELNGRIIEQLQLMKKTLMQKMFPAKGSIVPQVRFPGFTGPWQQRKVGDYYDFKNGLNKGKEYFGHGTPIVNFTDVFRNRGIYPEELKGTVQLESSEIENYEVKRGDIFFTRTSETIEEIGYPSVMLGTPENTVFSGFVLRGRCIVTNDPLDDLFKKYVFFTDAFRAEMLKKSSMTTRALTSGTAIKNMEFSFPPSKDEQHAIGQFLTNLDNSITLHQRKRDEEKQKKKALMQLLLTGIVRV